MVHDFKTVQTECIMTLQTQKSSKVVDFGTIKAHIPLSLLVLNSNESNLSPILPHFRN